MDPRADLATILQAFLARARCSTRALADLTGLPRRTLENWRSGEIRRPRAVIDVLKVAQALALDMADTEVLLHAAGYPSLALLQVQAKQVDDRQLIALLPRDDANSPCPPSDQLAVRLLPAAPSPHQLRAPVADFVGRAVETEQLVRPLRAAIATGQGTIISGVQGMGGIGKTELAYRVAQALADTFPDGQIMLRLGGASLAPLTPMQALETVIRAFLPQEQLPENLASLQARYRTLLHQQRVLILADDARDAAQVRPLLPPPGCALLVTSRTRFTLPGMTAIDLEHLSANEATLLLQKICPRLNTAEARAIAQACGGLPLALRVSGGILRNDRALDVASYLAELTDARRRLAQLRDPDEPELDVAAVLALSYTQLDAAARQVFRQLGVFVADFATEQALAVVEAPADVTIEAMLRLLLRRTLVMYDAERGRWRLHDLVRDLARWQLEAAGEAEAAQWRYARAAVAITQDIQEEYLAGGEKALLALARFDAERAHFDAGCLWAQLHARTTAGDLLLLDAAQALRFIHELRYDQRHEGIPLWEQVQAAAQRLGDRAAEGYALRNLGVAYARLGDIPATISYFEQALAIFRQLGDQPHEGRTLDNLGLTYYSLGQLPKAIVYLEQALAIACEIGDRAGQGHALGNLGLTYYSLGELPKAISCYEQYLAFTREIGNRANEGTALANLGNTYTELGDTRRAIECCKAAHSIARAIGDRQMEGYALSYLARAQARQGDIAGGGSTYRQACALLQEISDRWGEAECNWLFGVTLAQQGLREAALPLLRVALAYEHEIGHAEAAQHAALLERLEAEEYLPPEPWPASRQRAV
jgi:tetratricopeptide (TPR) repeat protein/transcriptional regulator with XRE-family HTH domain